MNAVKFFDRVAKNYRCGLDPLLPRQRDHLGSACGHAPNVAERAA